MIRRILTVFMLSASISGAAVWAADQPETMGDQPETIGDQPEIAGEQPGMADEARRGAAAEVIEAREGYITREVIGFKPQIGAVMYRDQLGNQTARAAYGITLDGNLAPAMNRGWSHLFIGPSTGAIFSHLGNPGSNILGINATEPIGHAGANVLVIPANMKLGFNFSDHFRLAAHGGGNVVYRSVANALFLGDPAAGANPNWSIFPNIGADAEFGLGRNVALMLRPDWTVTPGNNLFTGTVALSIPLG